MNPPPIDDAVAARAFRRLLAHLRHLSEARDADLMRLAGFCRQCLADWVSEESAGALDREAALHAVYGMPHARWQAEHRAEAVPVEAGHEEESALDEALDESFPASDPPAMIVPRA